jgi:hypothetical protein
MWAKKYSKVILYVHKGKTHLKGQVRSLERNDFAILNELHELNLFCFSSWEFEIKIVLAKKREIGGSGQ